MRLAVRLLVLVAAAAACLVASPLRHLLADSSSGSATVQAANLAQEMAQLVNGERTAHGLAALPVRSLGAQAWADHLAATGTFAHDTSLTSDAENIVWLGNDGTTGDGVILWMQSSGHRTNLLNAKATALDVGVACAGGRLYAVSRFHDAWAGPLATGTDAATAPRAGHSCTSLGTASLSQARLDAVQAVPGGPSVGAGSWLESPTGKVRFSATAANGSSLPVYVHVVLPCGEDWQWVGAGASRNWACDGAMPNVWTATHSALETLAAPGAGSLGVQSVWFWSRSGGATTPAIAHSLYPLGDPSARLGSGGWLISPSGSTVYDSWATNNTTVPFTVVMTLPCGTFPIRLAVGVSDHASCVAAAPADWVSYHVVADAYGPSGYAGSTDTWVFNRR